ncbi:hypothetical protein AVEN_260428-1 [Araneus ventricosus]|uniref:Uncharacterized protein n=1 Tax=Araneus ventricosus TaxID=182803 RepID=A0A4Y2KBC8_ARAVE|nr:hypothetical protein AVEN_260428-1 [Araneus ventricosus]
MRVRVGERGCRGYRAERQLQGEWVLTLRALPLEYPLASAHSVKVATDSASHPTTRVIQLLRIKLTWQLAALAAVPQQTPSKHERASSLHDSFFYLLNCFH